MKAIKPHLWFNQSVKAAAEFYASVFPGSTIDYVSHFSMPNGGECEVAEFTVAGLPFLGISAGEGIGINPSISFMMHFDVAEEINPLWEKLSKDGKIMMPLDKYPFSGRYGWVEDRFGVSWQLMLNNPEAEKRPVIVPSLMFTEPMAGKANAALDFYTTLFKDGKRGVTAAREQDMGPDKAGSLMYADFYIDNTWLAAMDSAHPHGFKFNDAVSLLVSCDTQEEIDDLWSKLTADGQPGQCGWLKDRYGVSWQITATAMFDTLKNKNQEQIDKLVGAFMQMQKVDIGRLNKSVS